MLEVAFEPEVETAIRLFTEQSSSVLTANLEDAHVTAVFVGRDLEESVRTDMRDISKKALARCPRYLTATGSWDLFGAKRDHLVALVEKDPMLIALVDSLSDALRDRGIERRKDFSFNPHVTIGKMIGRQTIRMPVFQPSMLRVRGLVVKTGDEYWHLPLLRQQEEGREHL